jgi:hypothetical protein
MGMTRLITTWTHTAVARRFSKVCVLSWRTAFRSPLYSRNGEYLETPFLPSTVVLYGEITEGDSDVREDECAGDRRRN